MMMPFALPDWVPWWVPFVLLVPALLYGLAFLFMPFSVIGVKSRLEVIEARLDEIQNEIRHLTLRLPAASHAVDFEEVYAQPVDRRAAEPVIVRPPIPPAAHEARAGDAQDDRPPPPPHARPGQRGEVRATPRAVGRAEPRIDWPR